MKRLLLSFLFLALGVSLSFAQAPTKLCITTNGTNCVEIKGGFPFPVYTDGGTYTNITTDTNTIIKTSPGVVQGIIVNTPGTASTATIYDNTTCTGTKIGTFSTTSQNSIPINATALTGICVTTASSGAANITLLTR